MIKWISIVIKLLDENKGADTPIHKIDLPLGIDRAGRHLRAAYSLLRLVSLPHLSIELEVECKIKLIIVIHDLIVEYLDGSGFGDTIKVFVAVVVIKHLSLR